LGGPKRTVEIDELLFAPVNVEQQKMDKKRKE
jgi:hypothetical protein